MSLAKIMGWISSKIYILNFLKMYTFNTVCIYLIKKVCRNKIYILTRLTNISDNSKMFLGQTDPEHI